MPCYCNRCERGLKMCMVAGYRKDWVGSPLGPRLPTVKSAVEWSICRKGAWAMAGIPFVRK